MLFKTRFLQGALALFAIVNFVSPIQAQEQESGGFGVSSKSMTLVDESRPIKAAFEFAGTPDRRLDVMVWYPSDASSEEGSGNGAVAQGGPFPLVLYSHGTYGAPDNASHLVDHLVSHGYVVAAPAYPLTSSASFTNVPSADITDTPNQPKDISFIIDQLLGDDFFGPAIDGERIGTTGISLGAVTSYFASFGAQTRDARIKATAPIAAADPVQAALASDFGFDGVAHAPISVPVLFLSAEKDMFARLGGLPHSAYSRVETPKYELMIAGGIHMWFGDRDVVPEGGKNLDCLFFEENAPGLQIPGCETPGGLIDPARQKEITREALLLFFDGYLKSDEDALAKLRQMGDVNEDVELIYEE